MTRLLLGILLSCAALLAQTDVSGKWTGTAGVPLYITFQQDGSKVSGGASQSGGQQAMTFSDGRIDGDHLTFKAGAFQFDLHVKGNDITGELDTGAEKVPVMLRRAGTEPNAAQTRAFEVASVKHVETPPGGYHSSMNLDPGRLTCSNVSLRKLIVNAYGIKDFQLVGPDWLASELYDIVATLPAGATGAQALPMMQTLLADRFHLASHRETREIPAYGLVVGKNGTSLKPVEFGRSSTSASPGHLTANKIPMDKLADFLARQVDRPVLDMTNLKGVFDFTLEWSTDEANPEAGPPIFAALQQQLGLKLEARKTPIETFVVDRVEKTPTGN